MLMSLNRSRVRVLVVEDSLLQAKVLEKALATAGFPVKIARDGVDAWRYLQQTTPEVVISDIQMPAMDGYELCRRIRSERRFDRTPVLLFTNMSAVEDLVAGLQAGADGYLTKPCPPEVLIERLEAVLADTLSPAGPEGRVAGYSGRPLPPDRRRAPPDAQHAGFRLRERSPAKSGPARPVTPELWPRAERTARAQRASLRLALEE